MLNKSSPAFGRGFVLCRSLAPPLKYSGAARLRSSGRMRPELELHTKDEHRAAGSSVRTVCGVRISGSRSPSGGYLFVIQNKKTALLLTTKKTAILQT